MTNLYGSLCRLVPGLRFLPFLFAFFLTALAGSAVASGMPASGRTVAVAAAGTNAAGAKVEVNSAGANSRVQTSAPQAPPISPALHAAFYSALAKDADESGRLDAEGCATVATLRGCFDASGAHFTGPAPVSLQLVAWGRGGEFTSVQAAVPRIHGSQVSYVHGKLTEWWRVLPVGFEQGFTIAKRPVGSGDLSLVLAASSRAVHSADTLAWGKLRYGRLVVTDAHGKAIPAVLKTHGKRLLIAVNDAHAVYPLTVDPLVWVQQKVTASDGAANDQFGGIVAVSGSTAMFGVSNATINGVSLQGAVYVFTQSNGTWTQTQKLTESDGNYTDTTTTPSTTSGEEFGFSVALSGTTAIVGAVGAYINGHSGQGEAYVFTESNGTWTETQNLVASDGVAFDEFGSDVAISGNTVIVCADNATVNGVAEQGAAYVYTNSGGSWAQTQKLVENQRFAYRVAVSGATLMISGILVNAGTDQYQGTVYVFNDSNGTWVLTQALSDGSTSDSFGQAVAISGATALIGAPASGPPQLQQTLLGTVYAYTESGGTWTQTQKLTASDGSVGDAFGSGVAMSGATAVIGAPDNNAAGSADNSGLAYVFTESNGAWTQAAETGPSDAVENPNEASEQFGMPVAFDGATALIGAYGDTVNGNYNQGAGYFEGLSGLGLTVNAPASVGPGAQYQSEVILTNSAATASPVVTAAIPVPAATSLVSATSAQGTCTTSSTSVNCALGTVAGNGGTATVTVTLKATGALGTAIDNTANVPLTAPALTANGTTTITGTPAVSLSEPSIAFGTVTIGQTGTTNSIFVTNTGTGELTGLAFSITGAAAGDFSETSTCPATLPDSGSNSCQVSVTFKPTATGTRNADLSISDDAANSPQAVALSGTGQSASTPPSNPPPTAQSPSHSGGGSLGLWSLLLLAPLLGFRKRHV